MTWLDYLPKLVAMPQRSIRKDAMLLAARGLIAALIISTSLTSIARSGSQSDGKWRITVASGVRLRSAPNTSAEEVARLQIGSVVRELERSASKEKIGGAEDYWYRISTGDGKQGWLFGSFAIAFDSNNPAEAYQKIASERLKTEKLSFADLTDLVRFLSAARADVKEGAALAELEFARVLALRRALIEVPVDYAQGSPYDAWIKSNEANLAFSDPAAMWFVRSDLFWNLQKKYSALPVAERIAWEGANNPIPGECEGYVPCHLAALNWTFGRYVSLYPRGAHAEEAMKGVVELLEPLIELVKGEKPTAEDKTEARKELAELRETVMKTSGEKKTAALDLINKLSQFYR